MRKQAIAVFLALVGHGWLPVCRAAEPVEVLLTQAESARSADPARFRRLLAELNRPGLGATQSQQDHIAYLEAYSLSFGGDLDGAIRKARKLISTSHDTDLIFRAGALIVNNYALNGHYNEGLRQLEQTLTLSDKVNDAKLREAGFIAAATLYNQIGQYALGRHYAELVAASPSSPRTLCFADYYKFAALLELRMLPKDDESILEAISVCSQTHEIVMSNLIRVTLARKWIAQGKSAQAATLLQEYLPEVQSTGYHRAISEVRSLLADLMFSKGDLRGAETNARVTTTLGAGIATTPPVVSAYLTLYKIADKEGNLLEALAAYKQYAEAERGYLEEVKARELAYHLVRQEANQKNQQIELLDRQNRLLLLQQAIDKTKAESARQLMLLFAVFTLIMAFWAYKTKRLQMSVKRLAEVDSLTGICNRHHFTSQAEQSLSRCLKSGEHASLIMFDLDYFKAINDNYGHVTGDWVLKRVARTCEELCRGIDHFGRIGGEEFAILLLGCDLKAAARVAEDARMRLSIIDATESGFQFTVTASFGVSATSMSGHDLDKLLSHADLMLYRAKREGRNRVRAYVPDTSVELGGPVLHTGEAELREVQADPSITLGSMRA